MNLSIKDTIGVYPNALRDSTCDRIIDLYKQGNSINQTYDGITSGGVNKSIKNSRDWQLMGCNLPGESECVDEVRSVFLHYLTEGYLGSFPNQRDVDKSWMLSSPNFFELYQIQKYSVREGHYGAWHNESGTFSMSRRIFAFLIYLNNVADGGETEFLYADLKVKPKKGTLLIHPAGFPYYHRGNMPISNDKYILISWMSYCPPNP